MRTRKKLKYRLEYVLLRATVGVVNRFPLAVINGITSGLSRLVWWFVPFRLPVAYDNLSTVFPQLGHAEKLAVLRAAYAHFLAAAGMILVINRPQMRTLIDQAVVTGLAELDHAREKQQGVICTTYHGCWFEAYFAWFSRGPRPTSLIYQQQSNPYCDAFFVRQRQSYGTNLEHLHSLEKLKVYEDALRANRILIVSLDQNYTDNGTPVTFFGKQFACARGAALLHLKTGAPLFTSVYYLLNGRLHIDFRPVELPSYATIDDAAIAAISNRAISGYEQTIRNHPEQWFSLFHRLWKKSGYPDKIKRNFSDLIGSSK